MRRLAPEQVAFRALSRLRRPRGPAAPPRSVALRTGWEPRVARCRRAVDRALLEGEFEFWGVQRRLALDRPWRAGDLGLSWDYPVHYHDGLPALAALPDADVRAGVLRFVDAWITAHPPGAECAWDPYPTALRIVNWLDIVATLGAAVDSAWRARVASSLWLQAAWLERRLERHLLGTHLLKNAKALAIAGAAFDGADAARWRRRAHGILGRELVRQVHPDGGHVEPSAAYHAVALEDVLDLANFAIEADAALRATIESAAGKMLAFARAVVTPAGEMPLLGDGGADAAPAPHSLAEYGVRLGIEPRHGEIVVSAGSSSGEVRWMSSSRLWVYRDSRHYVLVDAGGIGPPHLAAHGHCDSLSFEWWLDGVPIVVDTGTTSYERGPLRDACRASRAHNTLEIDGREQHEIWAAFRVARRARVDACLENGALAATLRPWHSPRVRVERRCEPDTAGVRITDRVTGGGAHAVASRLHLHPDCVTRLESNVVHTQHGRSRARIEIDAPFVLHAPGASGSVHCARLGVARANAVIEITGQTPWSTSIRLLPA